MTNVQMVVRMASWKDSRKVFRYTGKFYFSVIVKSEIIDYAPGLCPCHKTQHNEIDDGQCHEHNGKQIQWSHGHPPVILLFFQCLI